MLSTERHCQPATHLIVVQIVAFIGLNAIWCRAQQVPVIPDFAKKVHVRVDGKLLSLADAVKQQSADPKQLTYRNMRVANRGTPEGQLELALWCRKQKLKDEEQLHWRTLLLMQPGNQQAIKALKLRNFMGRLLTAEEIEQLKDQQKESEKAEKQWVPKLKRIKQAIEHGEPADRGAAIDELKSIRDPAALPFVEEVLGLENAQFGRTVIEMAAEMPGDESAAFLARAATDVKDQYVRERAATALQRRPYETYVPVLTARLAAPIELSFNVKLKQGSTKYEKIQWRENTGRIVPAIPNKIRLHSEYKWPDDGFIWTLETSPKWGWRATGREADRLHYDYVLSRDSPDPESPYEFAGSFDISSGPTKGKRKGESIDELQKRVDQANAAQELLNQRIHAALITATGAQVVSPEQKESPRPQIWWEWWNRQSHRDNYIPSGAEIWTQIGLTPVDQILVGDRVLTRDPASQDLAFHLVIAMDVQSSKAGHIVECNSRTITAATDQQFMVSGAGWRKASELKAGVKLDSLTGPQPIEKISAGEGEAARYGLAIANTPTLFVDRTGLLVHDATQR
jgi:hypothetical protein